MTDRRLVDVPDDQRLYVHDVIQRKGFNGAQKVLGLGRTAMLSIIARGRCMPRSAEILREAIKRRDS